MLLCKWKQNTNISVLCPCAHITKNCILFLSRVAAWLHLKWYIYAAVILERKWVAKREKIQKAEVVFLLAFFPPFLQLLLQLCQCWFSRQNHQQFVREHKVVNPPGWEKRYLKIKYLEIIGITETQLNIHILWLMDALYWIQDFAEKHMGKKKIKRSYFKMPPY